MSKLPPMASLKFPSPSLFPDSLAMTDAVDAQTGKLIWNIRTVDRFTSSPNATPGYYNGVVCHVLLAFSTN
ncbi:MAG TPA: hypothetical protein VHZ55_19225 [Bryobacteraceae bacterium]|nr:hypothetical protein [Bryobacteraceae bacterium]